MSFTPESIILSVSTYAIVSIAGLIKFYLSRKKKNDISALIIPWGSGSTTLANTFIEEYTHSTNFYLLDLEDRVMSSSLISDQAKEELKTLKTSTDAVLYESKLMVACSTVFEDILQALKMDKNRTVIVMVSTPNIATYLGIKKQIMLTPQGKLQKEIMMNYTNPLLVAYARSQLDGMKKKNTVLFSTFDDLLGIIESKYGIKKNLS